jgi:hypothetical protein
MGKLSSLTGVMTFAGYSIPQSDPPRSPWETLPTMYDLPSEFPEKPGLRNVFHDLQPRQTGGL